MTNTNTSSCSSALVKFGNYLLIAAVCVLFITYDEGELQWSEFQSPGSLETQIRRAEAISESESQTSGSFPGRKSQKNDTLEKPEPHDNMQKGTSVSPKQGESTKRKPGTKKASIAMCYAGETRTFAMPEVYNNHLKMIIEPIREHLDIFFVMSLGGSGKGELHENQRASMNETYVRWLTTDLFKAREFHIDDFGADVAATPPKCKEKGWAQGYKWKHCQRLIEAAERENGYKYDWTIRARPDMIFANKIEPVSGWPAKEKVEDVKAVWVAGLTGCGSRGMPRNIMPANDNFALMTRSAMPAYFTEYHKWFTECRQIPRHPMTFVCGESVLGATMHHNKVSLYTLEVGYFLVRPQDYDQLSVIISQAKTEEGIDLNLEYCLQNLGVCRKWCEKAKDDSKHICFRGLMGVLFWEQGKNEHTVMDVEKCICRHGHGAFSIWAPPCNNCVDNGEWNNF